VLIRKIPQKIRVNKKKKYYELIDVQWYWNIYQFGMNKVDEDWSIYLLTNFRLLLLAYFVF